MNNNPTALITGASRGIGLAIAEALAAHNYNLILTCSNSVNELKNIALRLSSKHSIECRAVCLDAADAHNTKLLFDSVTTLDVLVNNAGISHIGLLQDMSIEEWHKVIDTNLSSTFYTCKYAVPIMLQQHNGKILNISSVWGSCGASMEVAYSASKGGLDAFTKALAKELAPSHISVNALACGAVDTDMNSCFSDDEIAALCDEIPFGRMAYTKEIAEAAINIITAPAYLTGQIITVDGGWI